MTDAANDLTLAPFRPEHIEGAVRLSQQARWPHGRRDWMLVLSISRGVVALSGGRVVGTAVCTPFDDNLAAINMIVVDADLRGRGLGRRLMQEVMTLAGMRALRLVATEAGRPLYEKLGFAEAGTIVQRQGIVTTAIPSASGIEWAETRDCEALAGLDGAAFGAGRGALIARLLEMGPAAVLREHGAVAGFALCRPFGRGFVVGPVVARSLDEAKGLVAAQMAAHGDSFLRVDTGAETGLADWLATFGLAEAGRGTVMRRGAPPGRLPDAPATFALASQALG